MCENIKRMIKAGIDNYLSSKENEVVNYHVLQEIFPVERRVRSIIGGLETSFGTSVWEPLAKYLALKNGFNIKNEKDFKRPRKLPKEVNELINSWSEKRENSKDGVNLDEYIKQLRDIIKKLEIDYSKVEYVSLKKGQGIDLWIEKNEVEYIMDIKTTQINAGDGIKFNKHLLSWYAYRIFKDPDVKITAFIAIPFNPFNQSWEKKMGGRAKPLTLNRDIITDKNFWTLLSGDENTYTNIIKSFQDLKEENLSNKYKKVIYGTNGESIDTLNCEVVRLSNIEAFIENIKNDFFEEEYKNEENEYEYISYLSSNYINVSNLNIDIHQYRYCFYDDTQDDYETDYINYRYYDSDTLEYMGYGESIRECIDKCYDDYSESQLDYVLCNLIEV